MALQPNFWTNQSCSLSSNRVFRVRAGVSELQAIKDDLGDDFYRSVGAFVNTFESCGQCVFCFQVKIPLLIL